MEDVENLHRFSPNFVNNYVSVTLALTTHLNISKISTSFQGPTDPMPYRNGLNFSSKERYVA